MLDRPGSKTVEQPEHANSRCMNERIVKHKSTVFFDEIWTVGILDQCTGILEDVVASVKGQHHKVRGVRPNSRTQSLKFLCRRETVHAKVHHFDSLPCQGRATTQLPFQHGRIIFFHWDLQSPGVGVAENSDAESVCRLLHRVLAITQTLAVNAHRYFIFCCVPLTLCSRTRRDTGSGIPGEKQVSAAPVILDVRYAKPDFQQNQGESKPTQPRKSFSQFQDTTSAVA